MMSPTEYGQIATWFAEGRLQVHRINNEGWNNWDSQHLPNIQSGWNFSKFRRRPDEPTLPDEVWIPRYEGMTLQTYAHAYCKKDECIRMNESATPVRYVRAGSVFRASQVEWKLPHESLWKQCENDYAEYRFRP